MSDDLTDEQIDESAEHYEAMTGEYVMVASDGRSARRCFRDWLAAVEARAARRERDRIAANLDSWATDHGIAGHLAHHNALSMAASLIRSGETNWPGTGADR